MYVMLYNGGRRGLRKRGRAPAQLYRNIPFKNACFWMTSLNASLCKDVAMMKIKKKEPTAHSSFLMTRSVVIDCRRRNELIDVVS